MMCEIMDTFISSIYAQFRIIQCWMLGACSHRPVRSCPTRCADVFRASVLIILYSLLRYIFRYFSYLLLTYAFSLARSIGHRLRNATVFCLWPSSPFLSRCTPSLLYLFLCLSARCFVAYLFFSSLGGSM